MAASTGTEGNWMCFLCNKTGLSRLSSWKGKKTVGKSVKPAAGAGQVRETSNLYLHCSSGAICIRSSREVTT